MVVGGAMLFGLTTGGVYWWLNHVRLIPFDIFPVGGLETLLVLLAIVVIAVLALLWMLIGLSVVRRKWSLPGWGVAALIGILFASLAVGGALVADTAPKIHDRYQAAYHSDTRTVPAFDKVTIVGERGSTPLLEVVRKTSNDYKVELRSMGHADTSGVTMQETAPGTITVDITKFKSDPDCTSPCVFTGRNTQLLIYAPADKVINITGNGSSWYSVQSQYLNQYVPDSPPPTTPPTP
jgi:hypothetical protein